VSFFAGYKTTTTLEGSGPRGWQPARVNFTSSVWEEELVKEKNTAFLLI
jgi:hypothetical protein